MHPRCVRTALRHCYTLHPTVPHSVLLPFLYETVTIQRCSLHYSTSSSQDETVFENGPTQDVGKKQISEETPRFRFRKVDMFISGKDFEAHAGTAKLNRTAGQSYRRDIDVKPINIHGRQAHRGQLAGQRSSRSTNAGQHLIRNYDAHPGPSDDAGLRRRPARNVDIAERSNANEEPLASYSAMKRIRPAQHDNNTTPESDPRFNVNNGQRPLQAPSFGTMTDAEREAFSKLFKSLSAKDKPEQQDSANNEATPLQAFGPSLVDDMKDIHGGDNMDRRLESILNRELQRDNRSIGQYPDSIRGMAATARLELAREKMVQKQKQDEAGLIIEANEEIKRVWKELSEAKTDVGVWKVLEDQVFEPFKRLVLDKPSVSPADSAKSGTRDKKDAVPKVFLLEQPKPEIALTARTYPHHIFNAVNILCKRTTYTPLIGSILPAIRSLGTSSYVLGISTGLYNQLLEYDWRITNDWRNMLSLLEEMDDAALTLDHGTWSVLEHVTLYRYRALRGDFGEGVRLMEGMSERFSQGKKLWAWKREIKKRTEQAALERTRETSTGEDYAPSDEPDIVLNQRHPLGTTA